MGRVHFYKIVYDTDGGVDSKRKKAFRWFVQGLLLVPILVVVHFSKLYVMETYFGSSDTTKIDLYDGTNSKDAVSLENWNQMKRELALLRAEVEIMKEMHSTGPVVSRSDSLEDYFADQIGALDYAAEYMGGSIVSIMDTVPYASTEKLIIFGVFKWILNSDPKLMLQKTSEPGNCFAFHGSNARIRIKLGAAVVITDFGVEHIKVPESRKSAMRNFEVIGLQNAKDEFGMSLGIFTYDVDGKMLQTFPVTGIFTNQSFQYLELRILSNYGGGFTCVYRFRVHSRILNYGD